MVDSSEEDLDDWLFDSIYRYKQLSMFGFGYVITHVEQTDADRMCIAGKNKEEEENEIIEVQLPKKIFVSESQEGLEKDKDLTIERGGYSTSKIFQMGAIRSERKLITSEQGKLGVSVYDLGPSSNATIQKVHEYSGMHFVPRFSCNGTNVLLCTTNKQPVAVVEMSSGQCIKTFDLKATNEEHILEPGYLSDNMSVICDKISGCLYVNDLRSQDGSGSVVMNDSFSDAKSAWTMTSLYQQLTGSQNPCDMKCACASTEGQFLAYDLRNPQKAYCTGNFQTTDTPSAVWDFSLKTSKNFQRFSVSGCDGKVYVYDVDDSSNLNFIFAHDGHVYEHANEPEKCCVTCHMFVKEDMILSADNYKSLHCWQFVPTVT